MRLASRITRLLRTATFALVASSCADFDGLSLPADGGAMDAGDARDAGEESSVDASGCMGANYHFNATTGHCYRFSGLRVAWAAAESDCVTWGGHLVTVSSADEHELVTGILASDIVAPTNGAGAWIGLNDVAKEGTFVWTSGEPATFSDWGSGEPDGSLPDKDCVYQYSSQFQGHWDDFQCSATENYLCER